MADVAITIGATLSELRAGLAQGSKMVDDFSRRYSKARGGVMLFAGTFRDLSGAIGGAGGAMSAFLGGLAVGGPLGLALGAVQGLAGWIKTSREEDKKLTTELEKTATAAASAKREVREMAVALRQGADAATLLRNQNAIAEASVRVAKLQAEIEAKQAEIADYADDIVRTDGKTERLNKELLVLKQQQAEAEDKIRKAALQLAQDELDINTRAAEKQTQLAEKADAEDKRRHAAAMARIRERQAAELRGTEAWFQMNQDMADAEEKRRQDQQAAELRGTEAWFQMNEDRAAADRERMEAQVVAYTSFGQRIGSSFGTALAQGLSPARAIRGLLKDMLGAILDMVSKSITAKALDAGAGAAASQSSIPIVGPALAASAMIAMVALVKGLLSGLPSAAAGWDVPNVSGGILSVIHGGEKVLSAETSRKIDRWTEPQPASPGIVLQLTAMDAPGVEAALRDNKSAIVTILREIERDGRWRP